MTNTKKIFSLLLVMVVSIAAIHVYADRGTEIHSCSDVNSMETSSAKTVLSGGCIYDEPLSAIITGLVLTGDGTGANYKPNTFIVKQEIVTSLWTIIKTTYMQSCADTTYLRNDDIKDVIVDACNSNGGAGIELETFIDELENVDAWFYAAPGGWVVVPTGF